MTDKNNIPIGRGGSRKMDEFVETGGVTATAATEIDNEREVTKTFRIPESLGRRLKVHAAQTGQKEKDILITLISRYLNDHNIKS